MIFGICQGLAQRLDLSVFWLRAALVLIFFFTGFFPVIVVYLAAALVIKVEPVIPPTDDQEEEFYHSYATSRSLSLRRLKNEFDAIDRRVRRMEDYVTDKSYDWERRFRSGE